VEYIVSIFTVKSKSSEKSAEPPVAAQLAAWLCYFATQKSILFKGNTFCGSVQCVLCILSSDLQKQTCVELYRVSQEEMSIFWEVIVSVILSKSGVCTCVLFRTVSEIELFTVQ
jgi:hypothetical protein